MADQGVQSPGGSGAVRARTGAERPRGLARNLGGDDLAEGFLVAAVAAVLAIRGYLAVTGYPQIGGGKLHIAHMLWGGLGMLVALLLLLLFAPSSPSHPWRWPSWP